MKKNTLGCQPRHLSMLLLCVTISAVAAPKFAHGQQWNFEPVVRVGGEYDDNAVLAGDTGGEVELTGLLLDLKANIDYSSQKTSFSVQPRAILRTYPDDSDFDSDDFFLQSQLTHKSQLSTLGFRATFDRQSVRTGERAITDIDIEDPDDISGDETGQIFLRGTRNKSYLSPFWDYQLSDVSTIAVNLNYFDVQYDDVLAGFFADYTDTRLGLSYNRKFSSTNTGLISVSARRYDPAGALSSITGYSITGGVEHALSQKLRLRAMIGIENTEQLDSGSDLQAVGSIRLTRNLERTSMYVQYRRSVISTGAGTLITRDSLNLNLRRRLSRKISAGLGVRAYHSSNSSGSTAFDDRNYIQLLANFRWYLTRAFIIETDYRYTVDDRSNDNGGRSNSNQVNLWFVYQPKTIPKL